jgi:hypothetical protein
MKRKASLFLASLMALLGICWIVWQSLPQSEAWCQRCSGSLRLRGPFVVQCFRSEIGHIFAPGNPRIYCDKHGHVPVSMKEPHKPKLNDWQFNRDSYPDEQSFLMNQARKTVQQGTPASMKVVKPEENETK